MRGYSATPVSCCHEPTQHWHTMWNEWLHSPRTTRYQQCSFVDRIHLRSGHSSPGNLHLEHVLSYGLRQIPQTSSSGMSQRQAATAFHSLIVTFIAPCHCRPLRFAVV